MFKIDSTKLLIGSDFELMIVGPGDEFISALNFIEGDKDNPQQVSPNGHAIQADGVLFEANVPPVRLDGRQEMWDNIQFVIGEGQSKLPAELKIICCPNGEFNEDQLEDPRARIAGCDPDYNAWNGGRINEKPDLEKLAKRCCGFHLHFSYPGAHPRNALRLLQILDANVALVLLFLDEDRERRKLYGKAGCFRFKDYGDSGGVEYRALSNSVIKDRDTFDIIWTCIERSIKQYNEGVDYLPYGDRIQEAINTYNLDLAEQLCDDFKIPIPAKEVA